MKQNTLNFLIALKNVSIHRSKEFVDVRDTKEIKQLIPILYNSGFISTYIKYADKLGNVRYKVFVRNFYGVNLLSRLSLISKNKNFITVSYDELCRFDFKNKEYFLFTDKGIRTAAACIQQRLGGVLLFKI